MDSAEVTVPIGVPHVNSQDEIINGYTIKAGTIINIMLGSLSNFRSGLPF
jgi:cytochrome P450